MPDLFPFEMIKPACCTVCNIDVFALGAYHHIITTLVATCL